MDNTTMQLNSKIESYCKIIEKEIVNATVMYSKPEKFEELLTAVQKHGHYNNFKKVVKETVRGLRRRKKSEIKCSVIEHFIELEHVLDISCWGYSSENQSRLIRKARTNFIWWVENYRNMDNQRRNLYFGILLELTRNGSL